MGQEVWWFWDDRCPVVWMEVTLIKKHGCFGIKVWDCVSMYETCELHKLFSISWSPKTIRRAIKYANEFSADVTITEREREFQQAYSETCLTCLCQKWVLCFENLPRVAEACLDGIESKAQQQVIVIQSCSQCSSYDDTIVSTFLPSSAREK